MPTLPLGMLEPLTDRWRTVRGQVVQNDMHVKVLGNVEIDPLEGRQHIDRGVTFPSPVEHLTGRDVPRGEQIDGALALVVI